jgi:hypothetical protein
MRTLPFESLRALSLSKRLLCVSEASAFLMPFGCGQRPRCAICGALPTCLRWLQKIAEFFGKGAVSTGSSRFDKFKAQSLPKGPRAVSAGSRPGACRGACRGAGGGKGPCEAIGRGEREAAGGLNGENRANPKSAFKNSLAPSDLSHTPFKPDLDPAEILNAV